MPIDPRIKHPTSLLPVLVGLFFSILYLATSASTIQGLDSGEFVTVAACGGVAHPPGYPLVSLLGRFFNAILPFGTAVTKTTAVSALMGGVATGLLAAATMRWTGSAATGLFSALLLGVSPLFWRYATVPEVFAANAATGAAALWIFSRTVASNRFTTPTAILLGLVIASGIANHHTSILLVPLYAGTCIIAFTQREGARTAAQRLSLCAATALLGFAPYFLILLQNGVWHWGDVNTPQELIRHFFRSDYGTFKLTAATVPIPWYSHPLTFLKFLPSQFGPIFTALATSALLLLLLTAKTRRLFTLIPIGAFILCGPLFLSAANSAQRGFALFIIERFYILPIVILCFIMSIGIHAAAARIERRFLRYAVLAGLIAAALVGATQSRIHGARFTLAEDYIVNALAAAPDSAVIIGNSDSELGGFLYRQAVCKDRPDVAFIAPPLLRAPWYRAFLTASHPDLILPDETRSVPDMILSLKNTSARPICLSPEMYADTPLLGAVGGVTPIGCALLEVRNDDCIDSTEIALRRALATLRIRSLPTSEKEAYSCAEFDLYLNYARTFRVLSRNYLARGRREDAVRCLQTAQMLSAPWVTSPQPLPLSTRRK